jgi:Na+-transporting methylmalonyl-CoA/oxaloacetate decarboxylase gamma subunit
MENLAWGLQITVLGMGLVFALLALLWGLLALVLRLDAAPDAGVAPARTSAAAAALRAEPSGDALGAGTPPAVTVQGMEPELVAAIMVAVLTHKAVRRRAAAPVMRSYWPGSMLYASRWVGAGRARQTHSWRRRGK